MDSATATPTAKCRRRAQAARSILAGLLIASVVWFARFSRSAEFGLYEDDWTRIPGAIEMSSGQLAAFALDSLANFRGQGRPLHQIFIAGFSALGWMIDRLHGIYLIGYLIVASNAVLFYILLRRIHSHQLGIVGALAFALYSADSTQAFITHSFGLQTSLTLLLLASLSYVSRRPALAYSLLLASVLTYETPYFVFLAIPLLAYPWDRQAPRRLALHAAIMAALFLTLTLLRLMVGDINLEIVSSDARLETSLRHMLLGPVWSLRSFLDRPRETFPTADPNMALVVLAAFCVFLAVLYGWAIARDRGTADADAKPAGGRSDQAARRHQLFVAGGLRNERIQVLLRLAGVGLLMLVLAYPLTFTTEPYFVYGRVTRIHLAAVAGTSLLIASLWMIVVEGLPNEAPRLAASAMLALGFAALMGFGQLLQQSYVASWESQKAVWRQLLTLAADSGDGTAIVVDSSRLEAGLHIGANSWNMPRVLEGILRFPSAWQVPPSAYRMKPGWQALLDADGGTLVLGPPAADTPPDHVREAESGDLILIVTDGGDFLRQDSPIEVNGRAYPLKPRSPPILPLLERRPFFHFLIDDVAH